MRRVAMVSMLSVVVTDRGRSLDRGPCPLGYSHVLDGYRSCALDTPPCAQKVIDRPVEGVLMEECGQQCGDGCVAVSLFVTKECWLYSSLGGEEMNDEQSVLCVRDPAPAPPPPPAPERHWPADPAAAAAVAATIIAPAVVTPVVSAPVAPVVVVTAPAVVAAPAEAPCHDTPGWSNQYGSSCAAYNEEGHCAQGGIAPAHEWAGGTEFGSPEQNCCACGKLPWPPPRPPPRRPPPRRPPPPPAPDEGSAASRKDAAIDHLKNAGSDIRLAGSALFYGVPPNAILALAAGACTGLLLLAVGRLLPPHRSPHPDPNPNPYPYPDLRLNPSPSPNPDQVGCMLLRRQRRGKRQRGYTDEEDEEDEEDGDFEQGPGGFDGYDGEPAAARGTQRILVEVAGEVCSRRVRTGGCGSVAELREVLCTACDDLGSFDAADMILEYLDERAGLAILVTDEMGVRGVLDRATLKATFTEPAARTRPGRARAKPAPVVGRGRRRAGYERGLVDEADADWDEEDSAAGGSRCLVQ